MRTSAAATVVVAIMTSSSPATAKEYPFGKPPIVAGLEIAAVYLQPIEMTGLNSSR